MNGSSGGSNEVSVRMDSIRIRRSMDFISHIAINMELICTQDGNRVNNWSDIYNVFTFIPARV